ncbi:MAG: tetratricopeptide repeat protein [Planctomycetes bacterium]|nr:tetratricopeptide repeat protein [Planctomycetota bacterium]
MRDHDADRLPDAETDGEKTPVDPVPGFSGLKTRFTDNLQAVRKAATSLHEEIQKEIHDLEQDFEATVVPLLEKGLAPDVLLWQRINELFTFAIGKEVGFEALVKTVGREMHREIALTIEKTFPNDLERFHDFLAIHWAEAGNHARALQYCLTSLEQARRLGDLERMNLLFHRTRRAFETAIDAYGRAAEKREVALLQYRLGLLYQGKGDNDVALKFFHESQATYASMDDKAGVATCLSSTGMLKRAMNDADGAIEAHAHALALRKELGDKKKVALTLNNLGVAKAAKGDTAGAVTAFEEAAVAFREAGDSAGQKLAKQHATQLKKDKGKSARAAERAAKPVTEAPAEPAGDADDSE